jgi:hypothetical protein
VGYGAMQLPGPGVFGPPRDRQHALDVLRYVVETGVNHLDTAYYDGLGVADELIHEALHPYPDDLGFLASISPTAHRLALAMSGRQARAIAIAIAIAETEEVAPEIAKLTGNRVRQRVPDHHHRGRAPRPRGPKPRADRRRAAASHRSGPRRPRPLACPCGEIRACQSHSLPWWSPGRSADEASAVRGMPMLARRSFDMDGSGSAYIRRQVLDVQEISGPGTCYTGARSQLLTCAVTGLQGGQVSVFGLESVGDCCGAAGDAEPLVDVLQVLAYGVLGQE